METSVLAERLLALDSAGQDGNEPEVLAELTAIVQRLNTMIATATAALDATGALTSDGYRSPAGFLAGDGGRLGRGTARRYLACGRVLDQFPLLAAAAAVGKVTFDHVAVFACLIPASASEQRRSCLVRDEAELVAAAASESATEFSRRCVSWRHQVDPDDPVSERLVREEHGMTVNELDAGSSELTLRGTTGEIEQLRSAINQLADEEWRAQRNNTGHTDETCAASGFDRQPADSRSVDEARAADTNGADSDSAGTGPGSELLGGEATVGGSSESSSVRRFPVRGRLQSRAAAELAIRAVSGGSGGGKRLVVVVMDWATFNTETERFATGTAASVDVFATGFRSETIDGHPVPPAEAFLMALRGEVQRCVIGADSLKVDLGRQQRLFNAAGRRAVCVRDRVCVHEACDLPATWADIDHIVDWQHFGPTDTENGQALCRYHHIEKHRQTTNNDDTGTGEAA